MNKKVNPLMILLLPAAMLWSCISDSDNNKEYPKVESADYSSLMNTQNSVETSLPLNIPTHLSRLESDSRIEQADTQCKVVSVADGDTLTCLSTKKEPIKVRLNQIDAPEHKQDFGKAAKKALSGYVFGKNVSLKTNGRDKYGRIIAEVYLDGTNINKAMVKNGHAWAYREYVTDNEYLELEKAARSQSKGLWSQPNPIYPSEFRHGERLHNVTKEVKPKVSVSGGKFICSGKRFCREMRSCAEARFYLNQCGVSRLDRDNDGIPCESLC